MASPEPTTRYPLQVVVDLRANALRIAILNDGLVPGRAAATLDVGAFGRLLGLEIGSTYVHVMDDVGDGASTRSASVTIDIEASDADDVVWMIVPRKGPWGEITYPSWNSCWMTRTADGQLRQMCADVDAG